MTSVPSKKKYKEALIRVEVDFANKMSSLYKEVLATKSSTKSSYSVGTYFALFDANRGFSEPSYRIDAWFSIPTNMLYLEGAGQIITEEAWSSIGYLFTLGGSGSGFASIQSVINLYGDCWSLPFGGASTDFYFQIYDMTTASYIDNDLLMNNYVGWGGGGSEETYSAIDTVSGTLTAGHTYYVLIKGIGTVLSTGGGIDETWGDIGAIAVSW